MLQYLISLNRGIRYELIKFYGLPFEVDFVHSLQNIQCFPLNFSKFFDGPKTHGYGLSMFSPNQYPAHRPTSSHTSGRMHSESAIYLLYVKEMKSFELRNYDTVVIKVTEKYAGLV